MRKTGANTFGNDIYSLNLTSLSFESDIAEILGTTSEYLCDASDIKEKAPTKIESILTDIEKEVIRLYRELDDAGKIKVGSVLQMEHDRVQRESGLVTSLVAARSNDYFEYVHEIYLPDLSKVPADDTDL